MLTLSKKTMIETNRIEVASQWTLMWLKFKKHKLAMLSGIMVLIFYFIALFAEIFATQAPSSYKAKYVYAPPQKS